MDDLLEAVTIDIDDATLPPVEVAPVVPVVIPEPVPAPAPAHIAEAPEEGIQVLRQQLAAREAELAAAREHARQEAEGRATAERQAQENAGRAEQFRTKADEAGYDAIVNAIGSAEREQQSLQSQLTTAYEKGDFPEVTKLTTDISKVAARLDRLEDGKTQYETRRAEVPEVKPVAPVPAPRTEDPDQFMRRAWNNNEYEAYIASRTPRTAQWLRANPQFASDPTTRNRVMGTDRYVAETLGIPRDTEEYFAKVEEFSGLRAAPVAAPAPAYVAPRPAPTPAAPPSRVVPSARPSVVGITLSPEERQHARQIFGPMMKPGEDPEVAYARQKAAIEREGGKVFSR